MTTVCFSFQGCEDPSTHSELSYEGLTLAHFTETDSECDVNFEIWAGPPLTPDTWFIRDMGCYQRVSTVFLRNAHNSENKDRYDLILILRSVYCKAQYIYQTTRRQSICKRGDIYTRREGGWEYVHKKHREMELRKNCTSSAFELFASGGLFILPLPFLMICSL